MQRFVVFLILTAASAVLFSTILGCVVDVVSGMAPEAAPLLEEARRYGWLVGAVLGFLLAAMMVA